MSEFLGSRISLISKSDIRYAGTLHEINSEESTVSLENVRSFGTEGRRGRPDEEIAPSDQVYEYIVFRGSDVKDLRIEEHPTIKESKPPPGMPDDPAIVGARTRDGAPPPKQNVTPPGSFQPPYPPQSLYAGPPPPGPWGRGLGPVPMPGPGFGNMPYPPPPGWFPPGQGFPPAGQAPWANPPYPPPGRGGPPMPEPSQNQHPGIPSGAQQKPKAAPDHPAAERSTAAMAPTQPVSAPEPKSFAQAARQPAKAPSLPQESKPSADEVRAVASTLGSSGAISGVSNSGPKPTPTAPRNNRINPVVPLSGASSKPFQLPTAGKTGPTTVKPTAATAQTSIDDATNAARAAVALAMAQLGNSGGNAMDNLTKKVNEMRVNAHRGVATSRGRGRGGRPGTQKMDVPDSDFDFAQSNAKFNKEEIAKEATGGSPENYSDVAAETPNSDASGGNPAVAYNKSRSFFDNISSEARDRAENGGHKPGGREWRGEEQRKNMETFGQGSVDGGYRSNYRGRGRGRSTRSRGYGRGGRGGTRPQFPSTAAEQ